MHINRKSFYLILPGIMVFLTAIMSDIIQGKQSIILGPKTVVLLLISVTLIITGIIISRKEPGKFKSTHKVILMVLFLFHLLGVLRSLPLSEVLNDRPLTTVDYSFHTYQVCAANEFFKSSRHLWGYDPYFMAGYPMGVVFDLNNKCIELFSSLFSFVGVITASKVYVFLLICFVPLAMYIACRNFGLNKTESITGSILATLIWYTDSLLRTNWLGGMFTNAFVTYLAVLVFSMFYKYMDCRKISVLLTMVISGALLFYMGTSVIILVPLTVVLFAQLLKKKDYRTCIAIGIWGFLALVLCAPWFVPFLRFLHYKIDSSHCFYANFRTLLDDFILSTAPTPCSLMPKTFFFRNLAIYAGLFGIYLWMKEKQKLKYLPVLITVIFLFLLSYLGSSFKPTSSLQPYRFITVMCFLMIVPASKGICHLYNRFREKQSREALLIAIIIIILLMPVITAGISQYLDSHRISTHMPENEEGVIDWIKNNTDRSARLLYEDDYFSPLPSLLPLFAERELIGGLYPKVFLKHGFTQFNRWKLFGKSHKELSLEQLKNYFRHYNIKWIFCSSEGAKELFDKYPDYINKIRSIKTIAIYEVIGEPDFFLEGAGEVSADYNEIRVSKATGPEVILKYHWLETLRTEPELEIEEYKILDDPVGFIKVHNNNVTEFLVYNAY